MEYDIEAIRRTILGQADSMGGQGWMDITVPPMVRKDCVLRVPRGAFEGWSTWRAGGLGLCVPWTPVSPQGVKQGADDPYHTDWMLGAGLGPLDMKPGGPNPHAEALSDAVYSARAEVERRLLGHELGVLLAGPEVMGRIHHPRGPGDIAGWDADGNPPIVVLPDAGPEWLEVCISALGCGGAVVVERGGAMAHLVTVMRPGGQGPIVRMTGARTHLPSGALARLAPMDGMATLVEDSALLPQVTPVPDEFVLAPSLEGVPVLDEPMPDIALVLNAGDGFVVEPEPARVHPPRPRGDPGTWPLRHVDQLEAAMVETYERDLAIPARMARGEPIRVLPVQPGGPRPWDRYACLNGSMSRLIHGARYDMSAVMHDDHHRALDYEGNAGVLVMTVRPRGAVRTGVDASTPVRHYAVSGAWRARDVVRVSQALFERYEPRPDYEAARLARQAEADAREARFVARLEAMGDGELTALVNRVVGDERSFERDLGGDGVEWVECRDDITDCRRDFALFHCLAGPILSARGLPVPVREPAWQGNPRELDERRAGMAARVQSILRC